MKDEVMKLRHFSSKHFDMIPMTIEHLKMIKKEYDSYNKAKWEKEFDQWMNKLIKKNGVTKY